MTEPASELSLIRRELAAMDYPEHKRNDAEFLRAIVAIGRSGLEAAIKLLERRTPDASPSASEVKPVARTETGPVRIGDDWAGVFLRGDRALAMSFALGAAVQALQEKGVLQAAMLRGLVSDLQSCREPCDAVPLIPAASLASIQKELDLLRVAAKEACDLLAERTHGSPARSPGHNARLHLEAALAAISKPEGTQP